MKLGKGALLSPRGPYLLNSWKLKAGKKFPRSPEPALYSHLGLAGREGFQAKAAGPSWPSSKALPTTHLSPCCTCTVTFTSLRCPVAGLQGHVAWFLPASECLHPSQPPPSVSVFSGLSISGLLCVLRSLSIHWGFPISPATYLASSYPWKVWGRVWYTVGVRERICPDFLTFLIGRAKGD